MTNNLDLQKFMDKIKTAEAGHKLDLSSDEDLSIAIMNLISIEEHLFFTANKTGKTKYFDLLNETREMRKELLKLIVKNPEGEVWCTSKHLLAASMRLFEVGTKAQTKGNKKEALSFFEKSYHLYNLFWAINLGLLDDKEKSLKTLGKLSKTDLPIETKKSDLLGKVSGIIGKILDCCRE
ncbi:MAG: hypothetical protein US68_C0007G0006 [Candidatus Shapirobacteria bacterium GW2011_GWE1_38_10]|uniref:Uncharacterized protein n=1 Tax=Candidatus Shapirobacteria bacterium GW2011_GWE1_38_10 TaxID=1618488 RepID=A0A0G0I4K7_9BACT|nr:MAG: hypothetical protein US68_C0007G0006 [Candidatus Shapirobacteria bacterium GW2011_GWE1_38_10]HBP50823.1 hypothetical protein [Candidatus Shapirobacteria bacterium]